MFNCPECGCVVDVTSLEDNEILSCKSCGTELIYTKGKLEMVVFEAEDWGE